MTEENYYAVTDDWCDVTGFEDDIETHERDELTRDREDGDDWDEVSDGDD
jgi:hypothetical protein